MLRSTNITKLVAAGLAAGALAGPAAAGAVPIIDGNTSGQTVAGQAVAAGGGPGVSAQDFRQQNLTAPDQVDRVTAPPATQDLTAPDNIDRKAPDAPTAPTWPTHAQPLTPPAQQPAASPSSSDDGIDTGVWIAAAGGVALVAVGAGLALRMRPRTRQRSLA
jgi:hypothetical protein